MSSAYRDYDPAVVKRLQQVLLGMLGDFSELCSRHNLRWWVDYGAAIGALRHGGMIPWDDDIDICLLRKDYDELRRIVESEMGDKYFILDAEHYPAYPLMTARFCLRGTKFREECMRGIDAPFGIFLDLYCFENLAADPLEARRQWRRAWFWGKLKILREIRSPVVYQRGVKAILIKLASLMAHYVVRLFFSRDFLYRKALHWARLHNGEKTDNIFWAFSTVPFLHTMPREDIFPVRLVPFDGMNVPIARCAEALLTKFYGDFMTPPPPGKRHNHPPAELEFK